MATESRPTVPRGFLARYHADFVCALPQEEVEKVRVRLGGCLLQPFIDGLDGERLSEAEVKTRLEAYLRDELGMADYVNVMPQDGAVLVEIKGCHLCFGNDLLRSRGREGCCPFAPGLNRALSRALHGGSRLQAVNKTPGKTGECVIKYVTGP